MMNEALTKSPDGGDERSMASGEGKSTSRMSLLM